MPGATQTDLVGVCLAAGAGSRLMPLTLERPKVLCPVGGRPLLSWALDALVGVVEEVVVNVHHHPAMMLEYLSWAVDTERAGGGPTMQFWRSFHGQRHERPIVSSLRSLGSLVGAARSPDVSGMPAGTGAPSPTIQVVASVEGPDALGTAGALANLAHHLDGRSVLAVNADSVFDADLADVVAAWDGERPLVAHGGRDGFRPGVPVVASITPWSAIEALPQSPSGLFGHLWRDAHAEGRLQSVQLDSPVLDCGTPASYLAANLALFGGATSVEVGQVDATGAGDIARDNPGDTVEPHEGVTRSVLWSGARVGPGERLDGAVRTSDGRTVLVRPVPSAPW